MAALKNQLLRVAIQADLSADEYFMCLYGFSVLFSWSGMALHQTLLRLNQIKMWPSSFVPYTISLHGYGYHLGLSFQIALIAKLPLPKSPNLQKSWREPCMVCNYVVHQSLMT